MAEQRGKFLRGVLGGYIFRVVNNKQQVYPKPLPKTMKQTKATKRASNTFGMASSLGAQIRMTVSGEIANCSDSLMTNRLNGELITILGESRNPATKLYHFDTDSFSRLKGFEYNVHCRVEQSMLARPQVSIADDKLKVNIPTLNIPSQLKFPRASFHCDLKILVSLFRLKDGKFAKVPDLQQIEVTKNKTFMEGQELIFSVPSGCLCIVSLFVEFSIPGKRDWEPMKDFYSGCICGALVTPGIFQADLRRTWLSGIPFEM